MGPKARYTKPGKPGRSIEEVMVQRRLDATDPTSWPQAGPGGIPRSLTLPNLPTTVHRSASGGGGGSVRFADDNGGSVLGENSMSGNVTSGTDYSDNIEPMKEYCRELVKRNQTLELQLAGTVKVMQKELKKTRERSTEAMEIQKMMWLKDMDAALNEQKKTLEKQFIAVNAGTARLDDGPQMSYSQSRKLAEANAPKPIIASETTMGKIGTHIMELDMKVVQLKEIFRHGDPMEERRVSINKINACVRGWLQRLRFEAYRRGIREWKWLRCRQIVWLLDINVGLQVKLNTGIEQLKVMRSFRMLYQVYIKWVYITKQALPVRRAMYQAAMAKAYAKDLALVTKVWLAFKSVTVGGKSTKQANLQRREMIDSIREELSEALKAKGEIGVVPEEDIERCLYRKVLKIFLDTKRFLMLKSVLLNGFWKNVQLHRRNNEIALKHRLEVHAGKIFYAWSEWVFMVGAGLDRKRWSAPRQYQIHYNGKRVDNFTHIRLKRFVFFPWKEFYVMQALVRKMMQRQLGRFVKANFNAWRAQAKELRALRIVAVDNWRGYGRLITQTPFQGWAQFVKGVKNHNNEQQRIVNSYLRWKWRQRIVVIMKRWRHQALYGRIDGLYTRQMLIASLNEQKLMTAGLEKMMAAQTVEVDECRDLTEREINKRRLLENRLKEAHADIHKSKMYSHHAEQEMKRLEAIVEAVALLNPRQVEHLKRLQPTFQFKQRKVNIPKDEEEEDLGHVSEEEDDDEDDDDDDDGDASSPRNTKKKKKKVSSLLGDDDEDGGDDNLPSNICPRCRQLLPDPDAPPVDANAEYTASLLNASTHASAPQSAGQAQDPNKSSSPLVSLPHSPKTIVPLSPAAPANIGAASGMSHMFMNTANTEVYTMEQNMNIVSDEDMILLERAKWLIKHFAKPADDTVKVAYVVPGSEVRTQISVVEPVKVVEETNTKDADDSDDDDKPKKRGSIEDEMEVTKVKKKPEAPKVRTVTNIVWTPGQLVLPNRIGILPTAKELEEDQEAILGADGQMDTLLPGDPIHEPAGIDPEDTAARMLLGFMNFIQEGDVTTFAPQDRREWTKEVLATVHQAKKKETAVELARTQQEELELKMSMTMNGEIPEGHHHHHHASSNSLKISAAAELVGGAKDWRNALLSLRTMFPGAGNYSGVGVELDSSESQLYHRIVDMRTTLDEVVRRQAGKFDQKIKRSRAHAHHREKLILAAKRKAEAEEAARVAKEAAEAEEKERLALEEAAKMAAFRAAKAARKLAGDDSSDSNDEDEEDFDLVNPYANLLGAELLESRKTTGDGGGGDGDLDDDDEE